MQTSVQGRVFLASRAGMLVDTLGVTFVEHNEGCVLHVYRDQAGKPTIGTGHLVMPTDPWGPAVAAVLARKLTGAALDEALKAITCTQAQADATLENDLRVAESAVNAKVNAPLEQGQFDALVDFTFNCGVGALTTSTTLLRLNARDYQGAADALLLWDKREDPATGQLVEDGALLARRQAERAMFLAATPALPAA